jgi:hypothetical protein
MSGNRDNFSRATIEQLAESAGHCCTRCDFRTHYWCTERLKWIHLGNAAHDAAASVGGKRYDAEMTPEQRRAAENGAWLCASCATIVDKAHEHFPRGTIAAFQSAAMERVQREVFRKRTDEQPSYDGESASERGSSFCQRVRAIHLEFFGESVTVPFKTVTAIRQLSNDCGQFNSRSFLSALFPAMIQLQRNIVGSLNAIATEVTSNSACWYFNQEWSRYEPVGGYMFQRAHPETFQAVAVSLNRTRALWSDVQTQLYQLDEMLRKL